MMRRRKSRRSRKEEREGKGMEKGGKWVYVNSHSMSAIKGK